MPAAGYAYALILDTCKIKLQAMASPKPSLRDAPRTANAYLIKTLIVQWKLWTFRLEKLCPKFLWSFWDE
jgi:hypothetical protein